MNRLGPHPLAHLVLGRGREQPRAGPAQVAQPEGDPAVGPLALDRLVEPRRRVPLDEHAAALAHVAPARLQEPPPQVAVVGVDQEGRQQHDLEAPPQVEVLDPGPDGLGPDRGQSGRGRGRAARARAIPVDVGPADPGQHLRRLVHRHHRVPERHQPTGHPPSAGPQLQDPGPGGDRRMHDLGFAHRRQHPVQLDRTPVRRDHPGPGAASAPAVGHRPGPGPRFIDPFRLPAVGHPDPPLPGPPGGA